MILSFLANDKTNDTELTKFAYKDDIFTEYIVIFHSEKF